MAGKGTTTNDERTLPPVSNRTKFMLQDLIELKQNGWVKRRVEETAKTLSEIKREAAQDEARSRRSSFATLSRSRSGSFREKEVIDKDGFVTVPKRSQSFGSLNRGDFFPPPSPQHRGGSNKPNFLPKSPLSLPTKPLRRPTTLPSMASIPSLPEEEKTPKTPPAAASSSSDASSKSFPSEQDCEKKIKNILKEFFVVSDLSDAIMNVEEIVGIGHDGSTARSVGVIRGAVLLGMEGKSQDVDRMLSLMKECFAQNKIETKEALPQGLADPLEFLRDIVIDAPLAEAHLLKIMQEWISLKHLDFEMLLDAPDYFRTDGDAASFTCKLAKSLGKTDDGAVNVIEFLMREDDNKKYASAKDMLKAFLS
eukprot:CAMPEP_0118684482 /NCGR_PEP_ID=MMETSP0800-20121206/6670_1 /TAXON_ID=210618 ORGANISM="Striatella unipunctata, Strain CCMP2910" /NCGR_SAMPLE_ID=MMETSP0800 /ASSEMBLY_ACC=CAM_ASM_000638 /LENGTH=365 /DNA_ID=CAMNT_0006581197 /DNA_START=159 /DNA_END=1256 /DNA_ORIENTATION=+